MKCETRTRLLIRRAERVVVLVDEDAELLHEPRLLRVVPRQVDRRELGGGRCCCNEQQRRPSAHQATPLRRRRTRTRTRTWARKFYFNLDAY